MAADDTWMEFEELKAMPAVAHRFILRQPGIEVHGSREEMIRRLWKVHVRHLHELGFDETQLAVAEQVHGGEVAVVGARTPPRHCAPGADGLITNVPGRILGIYVADCCAVFLVDEHAGSIGLVHSGRKGSEAGIVGTAIARMVSEHGADPARMMVRLSPCIRPPRYEVDFAEWIRRDAVKAGVPPQRVIDDGACTGTDPGRFYSYRMEKGQTGRMLALLGLR